MAFIRVLSTHPEHVGIKIAVHQDGKPLEISFKRNLRLTSATTLVIANPPCLSWPVGTSAATGGQFLMQGRDYTIGPCAVNPRGFSINPERRSALVAANC
jgi:hypothetical protein